MTALTTSPDVTAEVYDRLLDRNVVVWLYHLRTSGNAVKSYRAVVIAGGSPAIATVNIKNGEPVCRAKECAATGPTSCAHAKACNPTNWMP